MSLWSIGTHLASHFGGGETKWRHPLPSLPPPRPSRLHLIHAPHRHTDVRAHGSTTRPTRPRGAVSVGPHVFVSGPRVAHPGRASESINTSLGGFQVTNGAAVPGSAGAKLWGLMEVDCVLRRKTARGWKSEHMVSAVSKRAGWSPRYSAPHPLPHKGWLCQPCMLQ